MQSIKKKFPKMKILIKWLILSKKSLRKEVPLNLATSLKILSTKKMLQRLPIAFPQVQAGNGNTSKNLLKKILQIIYSLYQGREIIKKTYDNIMDSTKV